MRAVSLVATAVLALFIAASPLAAQDKPAKSKPAASAQANAIVNLNTATAAELQTLPGVGAATARLILDHRQKNGGFKKIEELMTIKGIGEKSFLKIKPRVTVGTEKPERADAGKSF